MYRAFIISRPDQTADTVRRTLQSLGFDSISEASAGGEARRIIRSENPPELIIINAPLPDEFGIELAEAAAEANAKTILLCSGNIADELSDRLSAYDVLVLSKPVDRDVLRSGIRLLEADAAPFSDIEESDEVLRRIGDIRLINKAKSALMKYLRFTEPQAHRYIEKQAMNNRCTRREAAEKIITDIL